MIALGLGHFGLVFGLWLGIGCSVFVLGLMEFRLRVKVSDRLWLWLGALILGIGIGIGCFVFDLGFFEFWLRVKLNA
jgi:hypothetical protein